MTMCKHYLNTNNATQKIKVALYYVKNIKVNKKSHEQDIFSKIYRTKKILPSPYTPTKLPYLITDNLPSLQMLPPGIWLSF